jgi:hypothetical protein
MSQRPVKTQSLFLSSAAGALPSDTNERLTCHMEPGLLQCRADEYMTVTLDQLFTLHTWAFIPPGRLLTVRDLSAGVDAPVLLQEGNPSLPALARDIHATVNLHFAREAGFFCAFIPATNKLHFEAVHDIALLFRTAEDARLLGFNDTYVTSETQRIVSDDPIKPLPVDAIRVDLAGVRAAQGDANATNVGPRGRSGLVSPCNTLAVVPVENKPFTMLRWSNPSDAFTLRLADTSIPALTFHFQDWEGRPLRLDNVWLVLRVQTFRKDDPGTALLAELLQELRALRYLSAARALQGSVV